MQTDRTASGCDGGIHAGVAHFCDYVRPLVAGRRISRILVAGCGSGREALYIHENLEVHVTGVDIAASWNSSSISNLPGFQLLQASVLELPFSDASFDAVFYHHVLEHVGDPMTSLKEIARVLAPGGVAYVGTPNRHRVLGYVGSHRANGVSAKVKRNLRDWNARLHGKFRNEYGAHAGFSSKELTHMLAVHFDEPCSVTLDYLKLKYGSRLPSAFFRLLSVRPLLDVAAPSVYFVVRKAV